MPFLVLGIYEMHNFVRKLGGGRKRDLNRNETNPRAGRV